MKPAIAIKSCHRYADRRQAQLDTWLQDVDIDFFFLIGRKADPGPTVIQDALMCDAPDDFKNIAPKVVCACQYALEENITNLLICDDDTYIVYSRLMKSGFRRHDYVGHLRTDDIEYNKNKPYAQGSAFWISERSMEWIVRNKHLMGFGIIDDGAVGQALYRKVPFTHDDRYLPGPVCIDPASDPDFITTHKCLPAVMRKLHEGWCHTSQLTMGEG